jgi:hypothetical protein
LIIFRHQAGMANGSSKPSEGNNAGGGESFRPPIFELDYVNPTKHQNQRGELL